MNQHSAPSGVYRNENLLRYIEERQDDIEKAVIPQTPNVTVVTPHGKRLELPDVGLVLQLTGQALRAIHYVDAEILLNDGILNRMNIPIEFYRNLE